MRHLGAGELTGLNALPAHKLERDPVRRNARIRAERTRARMRALISVPPKAFSRGELARVQRFLLELIRVAPGDPIEDAESSLAHIAAGICDHLGVDRTGPRVRLEVRQERGKPSVRFVISDDWTVLDDE